MKIHNNKKINYKSGFTFMELVVVIAIFGIMGSIVMFNFRDFTSNINLQNMANDIALNIKKAQTLATSGFVNADTGIGYENDFESRDAPTFGVFFANVDGEKGVNKYKQFVLFRDKNESNFLYYAGNGCNDGNVNTECLDVIKIENSNKISQLCYNVNIDTGQGVCSNFKSLTIGFKRPYPDAHIVVVTGNNVIENLTNAQITISNYDDTKSKTIIVTNLGQIIVK